MKKIILYIAVVSALFSATPDQVEKYLLISGSEDQLIEFEQMVDSMGQMLAASKDKDDTPLMEDSQMLSVRFRDYIQRNLSEDEMDEIMGNYKHDVLRKLVGAEVLMEEADTVDAFRQFLSRIRQEPLPTNRTETVKSIVKRLYDEKTLIDFFEKMFMPMMKQTSAMMGRDLSDKQIDGIEKTFVKKMRDNNYNALLFMTRDFSQSELDELDDIAGNSATSHETRVVFGAVVYSLQEVINNMHKRFARLLEREKHSAGQSRAVDSTQTRSAHKDKAEKSKMPQPKNRNRTL